MVIGNVVADVRMVEVNGITIQTAVAGAGKPILLLHGWPFSWSVWRAIMPGLVQAGYLVIAPDLRGIGGTSRPADGCDIDTPANDHAALLMALGLRDAVVVGFDLGVQSAFMLAIKRPDLVSQLIVTEALMGDLPGAEYFLKAGPPWWFAFHGTPDLAEEVLCGNDDAYLNWFYEHHTVQKLPAASRAEYVRAYTDHEALRRGFAHYRAFL